LSCTNNVLALEAHNIKFIGRKYRKNKTLLARPASHAHLK